MKLKVILAGCSLLFSLSAFGQNSIEFFGFGAQSVDKLCISKNNNGDLLQIKEVYMQAQESSEYVSFSCEQINLIGSPIESLSNACDGAEDDITVSQIDMAFLTDEELNAVSEVKDCM